MRVKPSAWIVVLVQLLKEGDGSPVDRGEATSNTAQERPTCLRRLGARGSSSRETAGSMTEWRLPKRAIHRSDDWPECAIARLP